ncbi:MAG: hypothetical protein AAF915_17810 [Cyanobacteria bacterium P01_D01_bin.50]
MIRRLTLTAVLAVLSVMALAPKAQAQLAEEEAVEFIGAVGNVCTFNDTVGGTLGIDGEGELSTLGDGGEAGSTTVNCTGGGEITVAPPVAMEVPNGFTGEATAIVSNPEDPTSATASDGDDEALVIPAGDFDLDIDMIVSTDEEFLPGTYEYEVMVTATATE